MKPTQPKKHLHGLLVAIAASLALGGCQKAEEKSPQAGVRPPSAQQVEAPSPTPPPAEAAQPSEPVKEPAKKPDAGPAAPPLPEPRPEATKEIAAEESAGEDAPEEKPRDLGPPLVDEAKELVQLDPASSAWIDKPRHRVVMVGEVCQRTAPLEMFVCLKNTKEHEAVLCVQTKARDIHAALLAVGAETGHPVAFMPSYVPASGSEIEVTVRWKDAEGKVQTARGQDWVRHYDTKKPMEYPWVFGGSGFWTDERTNQQFYQAESGDFICVSNFPSAMLDIPVESTDKNNALLYEAFTERIPPLGTPVTIILTPKLDKKDATKDAEK